MIEELSTRHLDGQLNHIMVQAGMLAVGERKVLLILRVDGQSGDCAASESYGVDILVVTC